MQYAVSLALVQRYFDILPSIKCVSNALKICVRNFHSVQVLNEYILCMPLHARGSYTVEVNVEMRKLI